MHPGLMHAVRSRSLKEEDRAATLDATICGETVLLLLVADGHSGYEVAQLCAESGLHRLVKEVADAQPDEGSDAAAEAGSRGASGPALRAALSRTFAWLHDKSVALSNTAGATLTIVAWNEARSELTVANVGDSAAILVEVPSDASPAPRSAPHARISFARHLGSLHLGATVSAPARTGLTARCARPLLLPYSAPSPARALNHAARPCTRPKWRRGF